MVVSAIVLAALAPVTGALFGAAYGTSIRIGYEIIFPALFLGKEKTGAKDVVKALSDMYAITGGLEAHKFGIQQGLAMAKKNTESPDGLSLVSLATGSPTSLTGKASVVSDSSPPSVPGEAFSEKTAGVAEFWSDFAKAVWEVLKPKVWLDEVLKDIKLKLKVAINTTTIREAGIAFYEKYSYQTLRLAYTIAKSKSSTNPSVWAKQSKAKPNPYWEFSDGTLKMQPQLVIKGIIYAWKKAGAEKDWQLQKSAKDKKALTAFGKAIKPASGSASIKTTVPLTKTFLKSKIVIINSKIILELNIIKNLKISLQKKYTLKIAELIKVHQNLLKDLKKKLQDIAIFFVNLFTIVNCFSCHEKLVISIFILYYIM